MRKPRKNYTPVEKVAILRRHLLDHVPVSDLCDEYQAVAHPVLRSGRSSSSRTERSAFERKNGPAGEPKSPKTIAALREKASAQERGRRRADGRTHPAKKRAWGTLTGGLGSPRRTRDAIVDYVRTLVRADRDPRRQVRRVGLGSPPASSTTGALATVWPTSTMPGSTRLVARELGEESHPWISTTSIRSKATGDSPS